MFMERRTCTGLPGRFVSLRFASCGNHSFEFRWNGFLANVSIRGFCLTSGETSRGKYVRFWNVYAFGKQRTVALWAFGNAEGRRARGQVIKESVVEMTESLESSCNCMV